MSSDKKWSGWIKTMRYIREVSGTVYRDELPKLMERFGCKHEKDEDEMEWLNEYLRNNLGECPEEVRELAEKYREGCNFLKCDSVTQGVYTVPAQRYILDPIIRSEMPEYRYNEFLYKDNVSDCRIPKLNTTEILAQKRYECKRNTGTLKLILGEEDKAIGWENFDLKEVCCYIEQSEKIKLRHIEEIDARGAVFYGHTSFLFELCDDAPDICGHILCSEATFCGDLEVCGLAMTAGKQQFIGISGKRSLMDFRNVRFFGNARFRDIHFTGDALDTDVSFEDARFSGELKFEDVDFGHTSLYCFQTVFGNYFSDKSGRDTDNGKTEGKFSLRNVHFSDSTELNFVDAEMEKGKILMRDIQALPVVRISPAPVLQSHCKARCPAIHLEIINCEIHNPFYIRNVEQISFSQTENYSRIVEQDGWAEFNEKSEMRKKTRGLLGTYINSRLLTAIYNNDQECKQNGDTASAERCVEKAMSFMMLKENFAAAGQYDREDVAFILYMEYKPYIDAVNMGKKPSCLLRRKMLYQTLYALGKYGVSPGRVLISMLLTVLVFALGVYYPLALVLGTQAFSLSNSLGGIWMGEAATATSWLEMLLASLLFSLEGVVPFVSQFEPIHLGVCFAAAAENFIGSFLIGYFSVAVVRKTLR